MRKAVSWLLHHRVIIMNNDTCMEVNDKNMLTRWKESDTYVAKVSRHRWSRQIMMKIDKL